MPTRVPLAFAAAALLLSACDDGPSSPAGTDATATETDSTTGDAMPAASGSSGAVTTSSTTAAPPDEGSTTTGSDDESSSGDASTTTGPNPAAVLFEEDFEAAAPNTVPDGWDSFVGYVVNMNNEPGGMAFALADDSRARGGTQALHVRGGSTPAMLTRPLPSGIDRVYVRAYLWTTVALGQNPGNNHETLLGVRGSVGQANEEVRFGEIKGVIGTNEVPSDDISPTMEQWGRGPRIEADRWNCIEVAFIAEPGAHSVQAWRDGESVHLVNDPSQWNNGALGPEFLTGKFNEFIVGWHSFSNLDNELWVDDLVVATERVGC
ncbi:MAG: hypothetical protein AAGA54_08245 [Myxococcota bacterium]